MYLDTINCIKHAINLSVRKVIRKKEEVLGEIMLWGKWIVRPCSVVTMHQIFHKKRYKIQNLILAIALRRNLAVQGISTLEQSTRKIKIWKFILSVANLYGKGTSQFLYIHSKRNSYSQFFLRKRKKIHDSKNLNQSCR